MRKRSISQSSELLHQFTSEAQKAGANVYDALDFYHAIIEIADIAKEKKASTGIDIDKHKGYGACAVVYRSEVNSCNDVTYVDGDENGKQPGEMGMFELWLHGFG